MTPWARQVRSDQIQASDIHTLSGEPVADGYGPVNGAIEVSDPVRHDAEGGAM